MTNLLLLLILVALLAGFGFLVPILWVVAAILGLLLFVLLLKASATGLDWFFALLSPLWRAIGSFFRNDIVQWCLIVAVMGVLLWAYSVTREVELVHLLMLPGLAALIKAISAWDTLTIRKKYKRTDEKEV